MDKVIKIILSILGALLMFLVGWFSHAWKNRGEVGKEVNKAIKELNKQHNKALKSLKDEYDEKLRKKDEIISSLKSIIDRLIKLFESMEGNAAAKVMSNLIKNKEKLNNL